MDAGRKNMIYIYKCFDKITCGLTNSEFVDTMIREVDHDKLWIICLEQYDCLEQILIKNKNRRTKYILNNITLQDLLKLTCKNFEVRREPSESRDVDFNDDSWITDVFIDVDCGQQITQTEYSLHLKGN